MPSGVHLRNKGTTGMRFSALKSHDPNAVMNFIADKAKTYGKYENFRWDCEDYAFLAASDVRCRFLGLPVAIAIGKGMEGGPTIEGFNHAINILWFESQVGDQKKWEPRYFDATIGSEVKKFDTQVIIALPVSGLTDHQDLPPFDKLSFLKDAAFALDGRNYDFNLVNTDVMDTLKNKRVEECPKPTNKEELDLFNNAKYWSTSDRVFYWFAHIRRMHKGAPVGVAFGLATHPKRPNSFDYAALVVWSSPDNFTYWDVNEAKDITQLEVKFEPRIVIV
jgi:hypothetical protein